MADQNNRSEEAAIYDDAKTEEETVERQADAIFRNFLFERFQIEENVAEEISKSGDAGDEPEFPHYYARNNPSYEIGRQLRLIGEELDEKYKYEFNDLIGQLSKEAAGRRNYFTFMWLMRRFIEILKASVNFPVHLIKVSFQTLIALWLNPAALDVNILKDRNQEISQEKAQDVPDSAKSDVKDLDKRAIETYLKALKNENEAARHIRIMVIGMFGAGKTSLVRNLLSLDDIDLESTDGIDIHVNECFVSETDEWLFQEANYAEITDYKYRVAALMRKCASSGNSGDSAENSDNVEVIYQRQTNMAVSENEVRRQISILSSEDLHKTKKILDTFRDSDPVLGSFWKDICNAWEITESKVKGEKTEVKSSTQATVSIWDFAGQDIYYSTHHFFMNPASVYLLTMDISIPLKSEITGIESKSSFSYFHEGTTCLDAFKFWLNSVHTYSAKYGKNSPTVILVGTHIDKIEGSAEEKQKKGEEYFDEALMSFINSSVLQHVHPKKFFIDNTNSDEDFDSLRKEILELARSHRSWNQVVPARWILLERSLEQLRFEGKEMISLEDLIIRDAENEYPVGNKNELKEFLRFHHALGNLLYFDTEPLENHIILSPQWIVDAFRCFVTSFPKKNPQELKLWDEYEKQAKLSPLLLNSIIDSNSCLADYKDEVVKYMEHLDIMAQPTIFMTSKEKLKTVLKEGCDVKKIITEYQRGSDSVAREELLKERLDFHIVPCMLSARPPEKVMKHVINPTQALKTANLCYVFSGEFLPPAVFHRLIAVCINEWPVSTREKEFLLYRGLAVFCLTPSMELAIWIHEHVIFCRMVLYTTMDTGIPGVTCSKTRLFISDTLQKLLGIYKDKWSTVILPFEEYIQCDQVKDPLLGLIAVKDLVSKTEAVCKDHSEVHVIKSEEVLVHWYPEYIGGIKSPYGARYVHTSKEDFQKVPSEKELNKLSSKIGHEYFRLGMDLGLSRQVIQHCEEQHRFDVPTRIFCVLQKWKEANGQYATLEKLKNSMENVDCDMDGFYEVFCFN